MGRINPLSGSRGCLRFGWTCELLEICGGGRGQTRRASPPAKRGRGWLQLRSISMARQWRCAVVGAGVVGEWHVRTIPTVPGCTLAAVCDVSPPKAAAALEKNKFEGIPQYKDLREMLKREQIDVVHGCTPSGAHMDPCVTAMEMGKNVICEKPLEIQLDRIDQMVEVAKKNGARLAAIFQNRWN